MNPNKNQAGAALYRHGDVLVQRVESLPNGATPRSGTTLALGELTGHSHRILETAHAQLYVYGPDLYLELTAPGTLAHQEHGPIPLPAGLYRSWMQREYTPAAIVRVVD